MAPLSPLTIPPPPHPAPHCRLDWPVGNFVSCNAKNGYLKVWNASQRQPLESVRVASGGLVTVYFGTGEGW